jgi:hypothetical protein
MPSESFKLIFDNCQKLYLAVKCGESKSRIDSKFSIQVLLAVSNYIGHITYEEFISLIRYYDYVFANIPKGVI